MITIHCGTKGVAEAGSSCLVERLRDDTGEADSIEETGFCDRNSIKEGSTEHLMPVGRWPESRRSQEVDAAEDVFLFELFGLECALQDSIAY